MDIEKRKLLLEAKKLTLEEQKISLDTWKHVVNTQMHFNDLELRIRNFAFALTGAFIALGGYALKEAGDFQIQLWNFHLPIASAIFFISIGPLIGFYFMDRFWYHPLLMGSVIEGAKLERRLSSMGLDISMGQNISWQSGMLNKWFGEIKLFSDDEKIRFEAEYRGREPLSWERSGNKNTLKRGRNKVRTFRSTHKMATFYGVLIISMLSLGFLALYSAKSTNTPPKDSLRLDPIEVTLRMPADISTRHLEGCKNRSNFNLKVFVEVIFAPSENLICKLP